MKKQKTKQEKQLTEISLSSSKTDDEKELLTELTESESNSSSNWITESEVTVSGSAQQTVSESDDSQVVVISQSDDSEVVIIPSSEEDSNKKPMSGGNVTNARKEKSPKEKNKNERPRGNIPSSTAARPYLRSHSGSWRNLRKQRQSKMDKISASLPSEEPFQANLTASAGGSREREGGRTREGRGPPAQVVELPRISDSQDNRETSSPPPPQPPPASSSSLPAPPASARVSRSIENVISKLDRRSMSVLPHIGKTPSEGNISIPADVLISIFLIRRGEAAQCEQQGQLCGPER